MIMDNARKNGIIKGVMRDKIKNGVNMLQYADDTIFLVEDDLVMHRTSNLF